MLFPGTLWAFVFLFVGVISIVRALSQVQTQRSMVTPTLKEIHETQKLAIEKQTADLVLEREKADAKNREREEKVEGYVREIERIAPNSPMGVQSVLPGPGDDPELVREAWHRFLNRKKSAQSSTASKSTSRFR